MKAKDKLGWLTGACILLAVSTGVSQSRYDTLPNLPEHYASRLAKFKVEKATRNHILFLGNSITEGGNWRKLLGDSTVINRGISGDNTFGVLQRLDEVARFQPSKIFILIGVNDLSKNIPEAVIIENIFAIVGKIHAASPKTEVFVQSILPVNPKVKNFPKQFAKQNSIVQINGQLEKYSKALKYTFVDIFTHFRDQHDSLNERYTYDGLHLNLSGYEHWVAFLKKSKLI